MKRIEKWHLAVALAFAIGWIAHGFIAPKGGEMSIPSLPQAGAQEAIVLDSDASHTQIATAGQDGKSITIWVFSKARGNVRSMPGLISSKVFSAN